MRMTGITLSPMVRRGLLAAGVCLAAAVSLAPVYPTHEALIQGLVPITGERLRSVDLAVSFARNSAELTEPARERLAELGKALADERLRGFDVGVYGHTDATGAAAHNRKLSEMRAGAVVGYLVERAGLDRARFRHGGFGEERLLEGVPPDSPRHRRVEVVVYGGGGGPEGAESEGKDGEGPGEKTDESGLQAIR